MRKLGLFIATLMLPLMLQAVGDQPYHTTAYISPAYSLDMLTSCSTYATKHFWNKNGHLLRTYNRFRSHSYMLYAEYSVNGRNSLALNGGYTTYKSHLDGNSQAIEDLEAGWKHLLFYGETSACTAQLTLIIPTGNKKCFIRYGEFGEEFQLLYSDFFDVCCPRVWFDLGLAYRHYHGYASDQVRFYDAVGYYFTPQLAGIATGWLDYGLDNKKTKFRANNIALNPNYRLLKAQLEARYTFSSYLSMTIGGFWHVWGQSVGAGGGVFGGIWLDL